MKIWAKVRLKEEKNAEYLIRAFFKEFNPQSTMLIKDKEAQFEIIFNDTPPIELIEAINNCDIIEFCFGKVLGEQIEGGTEQETSINTEQIEVKQETSQQTEQSKKRRGKKTAITNLEQENLPQLDEIANNATSFEHFVKLVAEWLEVDKRQEFFENLVIAGTEVRKISWKLLKKALQNKGISYNQWDKNCISKKLSEKLGEYTIEILPFISVMIKYKDYSFKNEQSDENFTQQVTEDIVTAVEEGSFDKVEEITPKNRVKMECMPEIPYFEEILGSVDKTQPIEDRVRYVLNAMGLKEKDEERQLKIFEFANAALRIKSISLESICKKANISKEHEKYNIMLCSELINDFVDKYNCNKLVKVLDFLTQLQEIVMDESEIESN